MRPTRVTRQLAGTVAGLLATAPMTAALVALGQALPEDEQQEPLPPEQITENLAAKVGVDLSSDEETREKATLAAHFAYGGSVGALYAPFAGATGMPRVAEGMLFGLGVWAGGYLGMLPGVGLYRSAKQETNSRNALMIASHLVWGAALGVLVEKLADRE